jgi:hypothetical protein
MLGTPLTAEPSCEAVRVRALTRGSFAALGVTLAPVTSLIDSAGYDLTPNLSVNRLAAAKAASSRSVVHACVRLPWR